MTENKNYKAGLYVRLSRKDDRADTSDSIINQKKLLKNFIEENSDIDLYDIYVDDDYTGLNFDRPSFKRMINDLENNTINCIIVKDISRLGRDHIGVSDYIENFFPSSNCRFISVIEDFDSRKNYAMDTSLLIRLKSLINDNNSRDTSNKVRATKDTQRSQGKNIAPFAPYGYIKDPNNKHKMIIDEEVAPVVKDIFNWYKRGLGTIKIAKKLNELGVMSRSDYKKKAGLYKSDSYKKQLWNPNAIKQILTNKAYMGALDQKRSTTRNYKDKKRIWLDESDHIIVYDTHEPIISKEDFNFIQNMIKMKNYKTTKKSDEVYLFSGLLTCLDCGYAMIRSTTCPKGKDYVYYKCRSYNQRGGNKSCISPHSLRYEVIYERVLELLNRDIRRIINIHKTIADYKANKSKNDITDRVIKAIQKKEEKINSIENIKRELYKDFARKVITKTEYKNLKDGYNDEISGLKTDCKNLKIQLESKDDIMTGRIGWIEDLIKYRKLKTLERDILIMTVEKIYVDNNKDIYLMLKGETIDDVKRKQEMKEYDDDFYGWMDRMEKMGIS